MTRPRLALELAWRLTVAGRAGRRGAIAVATVAFVAAFLITGVLGVQGAAGHRADRLAARTPHLVEGRADPSDQGTRLLEPDDDWSGRSLRRVLIDPSPDGPVPPGVSAFAPVGTSILSPALLDLARHEPEVRARFGRIAADPIGPAGLGEPDELLAYTTVGPGSLAEGATLSGFGGDRVAVLGTGGLKLFVLLGILAFVAVPSAISLLLATRIGQAARRRQTNALRRSGLPAGLLAAVQALRVAGPALVGAMVGVVAHRSSVALLAGRSLVGHRVDGADLTVGLSGVARVVAGMTVLVFVIGAFASLRDARGARAASPVAGPSWWSTACLIVGLVALAAARVSVIGVDTRRLLLNLALLALVLGCPAAIAWLARRIGGVVAMRTTRLSALLGARRIQRDTPTVVRPAGVIAAVLLTVMFANLVVSMYDQDPVDTPAWHLATVSVFAAEPLEPGLRSVAGADMTLLLVEQPDPFPGTFVLATCDQLALVERRPVPQCTEVPQALGYATRGVVQVGPDQQAVLGPTLDLSAADTELFDSVVKVDPTTPLGRSLASRATGAVVWTDDAGDRLSRIRSSVAAADPRAQLDVPNEPTVRGNDAFRTNGAWFKAGTLLLLVSAVPGLLLAVLDLIGERRRQLAALAVMGLRRASLGTSAFLEVGGVLFLGAGVGLVGGVLTTVVYRAMAHRGELWGRAGWVTVGGTAAGCLAIALTAAWRAAAASRDALDELST